MGSAVRQIENFTMATASALKKLTESNNKHNQFLGSIVYTNELPDLTVDAKFLSCGRDLLDYTIEPVSFPELESQFIHHFKGLQSVFDLDLVNLDIYDQPRDPTTKMDPRDAALLNDIEALQCHNPKPRSAALEHPRAQEFQLMFAKERVHVPKPRTGLQKLPPKLKPKQTELIPVEQQRQLINQTFKSIEKPLERHPTKPESNATPIAVMPIFPDTELQAFEFVKMQFDIPPVDIPNSLIKDLGNYFVNFNMQENPTVTEPNHLYYLSDQRYKEERTAANAERGERFMLREKEGTLYYIPVDRHIKLRRERSRPQTVTNKCLLQVKRELLGEANNIPTKEGSSLKD